MTRLTLATLTLALAAPLAGASHQPTGDCDAAGAPALGVVEIKLGDAKYYLDDRNAALGNGLWLYQETNGVYRAGDVAHSLQRGGESLATREIDSCKDDAHVLPDTLVV